MTTLLLIRHGMTDAVGRRLTGQLPGIPLNELGRDQVRAVSGRLQTLPLAAIYASPLERTLETAQAIAGPHRLEVIARPSLIESDFGEWTGRTLAELDPDPEWTRFNRQPSATRIPGGEHIFEIQARMTGELLSIRDAHPEQVVAVVSHADPLRAALCGFLGLSIDYMQRIELSPAGVSVLRLTRDAVCVRSINDIGTVSVA
jgi:probable phosphoglycerate mutase